MSWFTILEFIESLSYLGLGCRFGLCASVEMFTVLEFIESLSYLGSVQMLSALINEVMGNLLSS